MERAGVSRTGFYNQFGSMHAFVANMVEAYNEGAYNAAAFDRMDRPFGAGDIPAYYTRFFTYIAEHADLYRVMLSDNGIPAFRIRMRAVARGVWMNHILLPRLPDLPSPEELLKAQLISRYVASAHIGLCLFYLDGNIGLSPEFMAEQVNKITWPAVMAYMGFNG